MSKFQVAFMGFMVLAIVAAIIIFSTSTNTTVTAARITIWGTFDQAKFNAYVNEIKLAGTELTIDYVQKPERGFEENLVESLASGKGPDVVLLPQDMILRQKDKVFPIPYKSVKERDFKDAFISEGELYLAPEGILALPFSVDPMVMYWNRRTFSDAGISTPPKNWEEFYTLVDRFVEKDPALNITRTALAFGEYENVNHAKDLISTLIMQAGNPITAFMNGRIDTTLTEKMGFAKPPTESALEFYTQFANPAKSVYSWNKSMLSAKEVFLAGDLAVYFGYASEYTDIRDKNPNLDFDVAYMPQPKEKTANVTFGKMHGFAIMKTSPHVADAFTTSYMLVSPQFLWHWTAISGLPPVRRDLLTAIPSDDVGPIFYNSALWARAWHDPSRVETDTIFKTLVESVTSGKANIGEAVTRAHFEIQELMP